MSRIILMFALAILGSGAVAGGSAERGAARAKRVCAVCHGADGNTPWRAEYPRIGGQHEDYIYKALRAYKSGLRKDEIMGGQVAHLSRRDMRDLAAYFSAQKSAQEAARQAPCVGPEQTPAAPAL